MGDIKISLVVILLVGLTSIYFTEGKVICFRKVKRNNKCAGIIRKVSFKDGDECCSSKKGSGFAIQRQKVGKNRFRCTPCSDINKHPFGERKKNNKQKQKKVDGGWSDWSEFSSCSETCGPGVMRKTRTCDNPAPSGGGRPCSGPKQTTKKCEVTKCPQDGGFSLWTSWGPCDVSCGGGYRARTRDCNSPPPMYGGKDCDGETEELKECNSDRPCPVDGGWSEWTQVGFCRAPKCGKGYQFRSRSCDRPRPQHGGTPCEGLAFERMECFNNLNCPVNGSWCEWSKWSKCSDTCDSSDAVEIRQRVCECPEPMFGGTECDGKRTMVRKCKECENDDTNQGPTAVIQLQATKPCADRMTDDDDGSGHGDLDCEDDEDAPLQETKSIPTDIQEGGYEESTQIIDNE